MVLWSQYFIFTCFISNHPSNFSRSHLFTFTLFAERNILHPHFFFFFFAMFSFYIIGSCSFLRASMLFGVTYTVFHVRVPVAGTLRPFSSTKSPIILWSSVMFVCYLASCTTFDVTADPLTIIPLFPLPLPPFLSKGFFLFVAWCVVIDVMTFCISLPWLKSLIVSMFTIWHRYKCPFTFTCFFGSSWMAVPFRKKP